MERPDAAPDGQMRAFLLVFEYVVDERTLYELWAVEQNAPLPPFSTADGTQLFALLYDEPLATYGVEPGRVLFFVSDAPEGRPLPFPSRVQERLLPGEDWTALDALPERFSQLRLPAIDDCDAWENSCVVFDRDVPICNLPCPSPPAFDPPAPPNAPALPNIACDAGWTPLVIEGQTAGCLAPDRVSCPPPSMQGLLDAACSPIGGACPDGAGWPDVSQAEGPVRYVDANATGGAGTPDDPYGDLSFLASDVRPITVALRAGIYNVPAIELTDRVQILGACVAETVLQNLRGNFVFRVAPGASVSMSGVDLRAPTNGAGVRVEGLFDATDTLMRGGATAIFVTQEGTATLERTRIHQGRLGLSFAGGELGRVTVQDSVIDGQTSAAVLGEGDGDFALNDTLLAPATGAIGVNVRGGVRGMLNDVALIGSDDLAMRLDFDATVEVDGLFITGTNGIAAYGQGRFEGERVGLRGTRGGFFLDGNSTMAVQDSSIAEYRGNVAFSLRSEATLSLGRTLLIDGGANGFVAQGMSQFTVNDLTMIRAGRAIEVRESVQGTVERAELDNRIRVLRTRTENGSSLNLTDVRVAWDAPSPTSGSIIQYSAGTQGVLRRLDLTGTSTAIYGSCDEECFITAEDIRIHGNRRLGVGILQFWGTMNLERVEITDVKKHGLYVWGGQVTARQFRVAGVDFPGELDDFDCSRLQAGPLRGPASAIYVESWAETNPFRQSIPMLTLSQFSVSGAECGGISTGFDGNFSLSSGEISDNRRGINYLRGPPMISVAPDVVLFGNTQANVYDFTDF